MDGSDYMDLNPEHRAFAEEERRRERERAKKRPVSSPAEEFGELQRLVDSLYEDAETVERVDLVVAAETDDLDEDLLEIVRLLPAGRYKREVLADQLNSIITAHGWALVYGTIE